MKLHTKLWTVLLLAMASVASSCTSGANNSQTTSGADSLLSADQLPVLTLDEESLEFGQVKEGEVVTRTYEFTNTGQTPLIIQAVQVSCGCTTPEYSKNPIAPGKKGNVKISFDSAGQVGKQHKIVTVTSNAEKRHTLLHLRGEVVK
jgi:hypothetical protein